ncbi:presenilin-1-like [Amblyomma americanum]
MVSVAGLVKMFSYSRNPALEIPYMRYPDQGGEVPVILINSFANAFGFLAIITIANCTLVLLYKAGHYRIVKAWLITGSALILLVTGYYFLGRLLFLFNAPTDHFSCALVTWNVGVGGIVALYFDAPCQLQQSYLVYASVLMAMVLEEAFPNWTSWIFLLLVSLWDVFAVLCFLGPLRVLHETAKKRNEPLFPALVFSTSSAWCYEIASAVEDTERQVDPGPTKWCSEQSEARPVTPGHPFAMQVSAGTECTSPAFVTDHSGPRVQPQYFSQILDGGTAAGDGALTSTAIISGSPTVRSQSANQPFIERATSVGCTGAGEGEPFVSLANMTTWPAVKPALMAGLPSFAKCADNKWCGDEHGGSPSIGPPSPRYLGRRGYEQFSLTPSCNSEDSFGARSGQRSPAVPLAQARAKSGASSPRSPRQRGFEQRRQFNQENVLERGLKLGLGDFIFYGMLLGKASRHGTMAALVACYVSVLVGVLLTVMLLFVFRKPLPALPFSVVLGLGSYFASAIFLDPFMEAVDFLAY